MGKVKYSSEMKEQTVKYVLEGGKSASKTAEELGIDKNTVCRWAREYREAQRAWERDSASRQTQRSDLSQRQREPVQQPEIQGDAGGERDRRIYERSGMPIRQLMC